MDFSPYSETLKQLNDEYIGYVISADRRITGVLHRMLKIAMESGDPLLTGYVYHSKAHAEYYITGNYRAFLKSLKLSARYLLRCPDKSEMKHVYYMIAIDAMNKGLMDIAHHYAVLSRNAAYEAGQHDTAMIIDGMIAVLLMRMGSYEEALENVLRSYNGILEDREHPMYHLNLVIACISEGTARLELGRMEEASGKYADAVRYIEENDITIEPNTLLDLAVLGMKIALRKNDETAVKERFESLIERMGGTVQILDQMTDLEQILSLLLDCGDHERASRLMEAVGAHEIPDDANHARRIRNGMKIDYYTATGDRESLHKAYEEEESENGSVAGGQKGNQGLANELIRLTNELLREQESIRRENELIRQMANTDALCDIPNRYALNTQLETTFENAYRERRRMGLCLMDVDGLKAYNDTYGHAAGDDCLVRIGEVLKRFSRDEGAFVARYGGDEFVLLFADKTDEEITASLLHLTGAMPLKLSAGVCNAVPDNRHRSWDFLAIADKALYMIKKTKKAAAGIARRSQEKDFLICDLSLE